MGDSLSYLDNLLVRMSFEHMSRDLVSLFAFNTPYVLSDHKSCSDIFWSAVCASVLQHTLHIN